MNQNRRSFMRQLGQYAAGTALITGMPLILSSCAGEGAAEQGQAVTSDTEVSPKYHFGISLAGYSLHRAMENKEMDSLDFPVKTRNDFGLDAMEWLSRDLKGHAEDTEYLNQVLKIGGDHDVKNLLIMVDDEGDLGSLDEAARTTAIENHYQWVTCAKHLGCHSIRVNAAGQGSREEVAAAAVDGLGRLSEFAAQHNINVIVENHGGYSSNGQWLSGVLGKVGMDNCGALPDFGNVCVSSMPESHPDGAKICDEGYDRYQLVTDLMPFAKAVSAKSHGFDEQGNENHTDYKKMLQVVKDAGYTGYVGIEYEGNFLSEPDGILATKALLERVREELA